MAMSSDDARAAPHPRLAGLVDGYTGSRLSGFPAGVHVGSPGLTVSVILALRDHHVLLSESDRRQDPVSYTSLVAGLRTTPVLILHHGSAATLTIDFTLAGVRHLLGTSAGELAGTFATAPAVLGSPVERLRQRVEQVDDWPAAFALVDRFLLDRLPDQSRTETTLAEAAWHMIRSGHGRVPVATVAERLGYSQRTLHSRLRHETGLGPKALSRIARFNTARRLVHRRLLLEIRAPSLAQIAADCGYHDESHLIREWRGFTGSAPVHWRTDDEFAFHHAHRTLPTAGDRVRFDWSPSAGSTAQHPRI